MKGSLSFKDRRDHNFLRFSIDITDKQKFLSVLRGEAKVERQTLKAGIDFQLLLKIKFEKKTGSLEMKNLYQSPNLKYHEIDRYDDLLKLLIDTYYRGMRLEESAYCWFDETEQEVI